MEAMTEMMGKFHAPCSPYQSSPTPVTNWTTHSYEPYEPTFDDEEPPFSPHDPDDVENATSTAAQTPAPAGTDDPDAQVPTTNGAVTPGRTVVEVNGGGGDVSHQQQGKKNAVKGLREKRIADDQRSTTPYMTKYERARVLGTRALQIRYVRNFNY